MSTFNMPDLGEGLQEAEILEWHVAPGDHVVADQPLLSVETDKAVVEVPSPWSGTVRKLFVEAGAIAEIGAPVAEIDAETRAGDDAGAIVGEIRPSGQKAPAETPARPAASGKAAPAVRKHAAKLGVDLAGLTGSGPGGTITRADVDRAAGADTGNWEPLRGVRRAMAINMEKARAEVATTSVFDEADVTAWSGREDTTIRLVLAIAAACAAEPALNARFDAAKMARLLHKRVDLGIAVDTEDGLFVPVLNDIGHRTAADLRSGLDRMRADIVTRSIPREDLKGQTITLSNFGMIGGRHAAMTVMPPQVAILGAGRIRDEVRVVDGAVAPRRILPLSLTFDHRAVTGAEGARFLMAAKRSLEEEGSS